MRLGARVVLCLLALSLAAGWGCRKPLTPNIDKNEPPETWISAAPMDTLTVKGPGGVVVPNPPVTMIPVRFHLYWAGSDKDGSIAGFYFAVVETSTVGVPGFGLPPLPSPKPSDYHFTTKTDSTFIFTVDELTTDRLHVFYIYAVDNQGKQDPTPARFLFAAIDRFPPMPVFDQAFAVGDTVELDAFGNPIPHRSTWNMTQPLRQGEVPSEHVPVGSELTFAWHGEVSMPSVSITKYKYKLEEPAFITVDANVTSVTYGTTTPVTPGAKLFTLRAIDQANGAGEATRNFFVNLLPDTWWAGPDPAQFPLSSDGEMTSNGQRARAFDVNHWPGDDDCTAPYLSLVPGQSPGSLPRGSFGGTFGTPDSILYRPSKRYPPNAGQTRDKTHWMKTFYEIYKNRIYARSEGDTVHANSFVVLWNGGYDKDSDYRVPADTTDPIIASAPGSDSLCPAKPTLTGEVIQNAGRMGSPVGFRALIVTRLTPVGLPSSPAWSPVYPNYLPGSSVRSPCLGFYAKAVKAGKAYALVRAQDADGGQDLSVSDIISVADNPGADPDLRRKVLTFYVDKAPALVTNNPAPDVFRPNPRPTGYPAAIDTFPDVPGSCSWNFRLIAMDFDPLDPTVASPKPGGPTNPDSPPFRYKITLYGKNLAGNDTAWTYVHTNGSQYVQVGGMKTELTLFANQVKNPFASGDMYASIQLCDCFDCETSFGQGRCVDGRDPPPGAALNPDNYIHFYFKRPPTCP